MNKIKALEISKMPSFNKNLLLLWQIKLIIDQKVKYWVKSTDLMDSRQKSFLNVPPQLFSSHHNHQLRGQLNQTASRVALGPKQVLIL